MNESSGFFFSVEDSEKPALLSIELKHIYGGQVHLRHSLHYFHLHTADDPPVCSRFLVYFSSRYPILYNPVTQSQTFYTNHKERVSAIDLHRTLEIVATADNKSIHVWKFRERVTVAKLESSLQGIYLLKFGNNKQGGEVLAAVGWSEGLAGVELFN